MLKVSLHFATPATVSPENILGRLDIGYDRLDAMADYKAVLSITGEGENAPIQIKDYPRWSASVWDLVARAICKSIHHGEHITPVDTKAVRQFAFIDNMTALIEHWPDGLDTRRSTIGTAHIQMLSRRGNYRATLGTDVAGDLRTSTIFAHRPRRLEPWDLLARAYAWTFNEGADLPPRPRLYVPIPIRDGPQSLVSLDTVSEPSYSGIMKWLTKRNFETVRSDVVDGPCVLESQFVQFLKTAV